jgi:hypothetical protein
MQMNIDWDQKKYNEVRKNQDFTSCSKGEIEEFEFRHADLRNANFKGCKHLYGKDFSGANLSNANFEGANICGTNFKGANLKCANFGKAKANYPFLWNVTIKLLILILNVLSALVIFHSIDIFQRFISTPDDLTLRFGEAVLQMVEVVSLDIQNNGTEAAWPDPISNDIEVIKNNFEAVFDSTSNVSTAVFEKCADDAEWFLESQENIEACKIAERVNEILYPKEFVLLLTILFLVSLGGIGALVALSVNPNLFGIIIIVIAVSVALAALNESSTAIPILFSLIALLGIVSGLLVRAVAVATSLATRASKRGFRFFNLFYWLSCLLGMTFLAGLTMSLDVIGNLIWFPLICSIAVLFFGGLIGKKTIFSNEESSLDSGESQVSVESKRYFLLEFFVARILRMGPVTNFWGAEMEGVNFTGAKLKEYSTSIGGRKYNDQTLEAILRRGDSTERFYKKMESFSNVWGDGLLYGGLIVSVVSNRIQKISVLGDFINDGVILWDKVFGSVNNAVNKLPEGIVESDEVSIKQSLVNLKEALGSEESLSEQNRFEALRQVEDLANTIQAGLDS